MRSSNGGWHGLAGWGCFRRFPETGVGLWADDGADPLSHAGSPVLAADLCLAELRSVSEISGVEGLSRLLDRKARRTALLSNGGTFQADQAGRTARRRRRVPAALSLGHCWVGKSAFAPCPPLHRPRIIGWARWRLAHLTFLNRANLPPSDAREKVDGQTEAEIASRGEG